MRLSGQSLASSERSLIWQQIDEGQLPRRLCCCHQRRELCELGSPWFVSDLKAPSAREVGALATTDRRHRSQAGGARGRDLLRDSVRCRGAEAAEKNLCIDGRCPESAVSGTTESGVLRALSDAAEAPADMLQVAGAHQHTGHAGCWRLTVKLASAMRLYSAGKRDGGTIGST